ncbi:hypothetical protein [Bradyrhizobium ottawaense]|uniref:hypothetical protein n=1 Tax=Bradyrhizobium ottawaense TaxID=931866 RepID=UPI003FA06CA7
MTSVEHYTQLAEHYREAKLKAEDAFTRYHLETLERSYCILAESEALLIKSVKLGHKLGKPG